MRRPPLDVDAGAGADAGSVTAEFAAVIPAVLLVLAFCLGAVSVACQQVRLTDAAADSARSIARGDGESAARSRVSESVGSASVAQQSSGDYICVRVTQPAAVGPAGLLGMTVSGRGCALGEAQQ